MYTPIDADTGAVRSPDWAGSRARPTWALVGLAALPLWLASFAWVRPLAEPDEGRYTEIARWMTVTGDWLVPRIDGMPFLHKPPLYYWLEAGVIEVLGSSLLSARLVSLAAALVTCVCVHALVGARADRRSADWTLGVLATSPMFFAAAQFANLDMLVTACITATITLAVVASDAPRESAGPAWLGAYAAAALGVLAKGLIGAVIPAAVFVTWALADGQPERIRRAISLHGMIVFAAIAAPWFILMELRFPGFNRTFFLYHHFERFMTGEFNGHYGLWFYPLVLGAGLLPWAPLPWASRRMRADAAGARDGRRGSLRRLGVAWLAFVVVFYSMPESKMIGYIFPAVPAFALIAGPTVARWHRRRQVLTLGIVLCLGLGIFGPHWEKRTPIALADQLANRIAPSDDVIAMDGYYYDVSARLKRDRPILVHGDWSHRSVELPDSLRRQLVEGRERDGEAGRVLIGDAELAARIAHPQRRTWIFAHAGSARLNAEASNLVVVARDGKHVLLMAEPR